MKIHHSWDGDFHEHGQESPRFFGQLTRQLIHAPKLYKVHHQLPDIFPFLMFGRPTYVLRAGELGMTAGNVQLLAGLWRLEVLLLRLQVIEGELRTFNTQKAIT